jgi:hypothetical protein
VASGLITLTLVQLWLLRSTAGGQMGRSIAAQIAATLGLESGLGVYYDSNPFDPTCVI